MNHFYTLALLAFLGASWQTRLHKGGWPNTLIPAYTMLATVCGLGVHISLTQVTRFTHRIDVPALSPSLGRLLLLVLILLQFISLAYMPLVYVPSADDRSCAEQTIEAFESMDTPLFSPCIRTWLLKPDTVRPGIQWLSSISYRPLRTPNSKYFGAISVTRWPPTASKHFSRAHFSYSKHRAPMTISQRSR